MSLGTANGNSYEKARRERVQENLKRFEGMGISTISRSLLEVAKCEYKLLKCQTSLKSKKILDTSELRRSSRARNPIPTYRDEVDNIDLRSYRKRYIKRSYDGVRIASYEEQVRAINKAEKLQSDLKLGHPSFVKPMVRSHVSSCFWLGLPSRFCKDHLPPHELKMVLEDEDGLEYEAIYIGNRTGLSGGWRGFSLDHNLDDGDVLVFELCQPAKFKVYIIKAIEQSDQDNDNKLIDTEVGTTKSTNTSIEDNDVSVSQKAQVRKGSSKRTRRPVS